MNNLNILIVEDESLVALELESSISSYGYTVVEYATNSKMARDFIRRDGINLILMDINLREDIDGIDLYRSFNIETPIIYLTAYKDEKHISKAITTNPLGYLIKPINEGELKALLLLANYKIGNTLATEIDKDKMINIGEDYFFNDIEDKLYLNNIEISLSPNELKLIKLLIKAKNSIVTFETIESEIWNSKAVSSSALRTLIYRLRGKLHYKLIKNKFREGLLL